jgi:hypothetical protein
MTLTLFDSFCDDFLTDATFLRLIYAHLGLQNWQVAPHHQPYSFRATNFTVSLTIQEDSDRTSRITAHNPASLE